MSQSINNWLNQSIKSTTILFLKQPNNMKFHKWEWNNPCMLIFEQLLFWMDFFFFFIKIILEFQQCLLSDANVRKIVQTAFLRVLWVHRSVHSQETWKRTIESGSSKTFNDSPVKIPWYLFIISSFVDIFGFLLNSFQLEKPA